MSLHKLQDINALADPLKQFEATFYIAVPPSNPFDAELSNQLELRAQSFTFPTITGDVTDVTWGGHNRQYAGKQTRQGDWNVTFTEVWSGQVIDGFKKWMNQYHNFVNGTISLFDNYKTTIKVTVEDFTFLKGFKTICSNPLVSAIPKAINEIIIITNGSNI